MKKNYNTPATEVVAFESGMLMQIASPNPDPNDSSVNGDPIP